MTGVGVEGEPGGGGGGGGDEMRGMVVKWKKGEK